VACERLGDRGFLYRKGREDAATDKMVDEIPRNAKGEEI
jgi:hypothetical protein